MKKEQFSDMMNHIDDELIVNAKAKGNAVRKISWKKMGVVAACFCLLLSAVIVIPMRNNNVGIISKYNGNMLVDSICRVPLPGECLFFPEVKRARQEYAGKNVKFLLAIDIFNGTETRVTDEELKAEYQRLADLGYKLYYVEDHWTYYGEGEKKYIPIVVGLFTEEQLTNFELNEKYGYAFYFATNGDGSEISVDEENTVANFNSILY